MISDQGTILRLYPLRETSLIVVWLTANHGIQRTVAKSARQIKNPFHGHLDLFFHNELQWTLGKSGNLHHLVSTSIIDARLGIRKDYDKISLLAYFSKLLQLTIEPEHPAQEFHDLLQRAIAHLESSPASKRALVHFERELTRLHGIRQDHIPPYAILKNQFGKIPAQRDRLWSSLPER